MTSSADDITGFAEADANANANAEAETGTAAESPSTRLASLLPRNRAFARDHGPQALAPPTAALVVVTCIDHRVDPAVTLGLRLGEAPVVRNAGGRVTPTVISDLAYLAFLARTVFGLEGPLFEIAVIHHTQCGTGFLADDVFRRQAVEATGLAEEVLAATEVADPYATVRTDVERLLASPLLPSGISVSGHVYDVETGHVTTTIDARSPLPVTGGRALLD